MIQQLSENLFCYADTCNVYVVRSEADGVLIDFGSGEVLDHLAELGIKRVAAVLMTHHHRDQGQGLWRAVQARIPVWVPQVEQDLFRDVDAHWQARELLGSYNNRQDRYSVLEGIPVVGILCDYSTLAFGGQSYTVAPTPGHTVGSLSLMAEVDGRCVAFTGDLIAAPGKTWSLAAMQWGYNDACGAAASIASLLDLKERGPDWLLPSHGSPIAEPAAAIDLLVDRLRQLLDWRGENPRLLQWRSQPYQTITRHVLWNRTSLAYSYVLLSESGKALLIDFGYDFMTGMAGGCDRAARRPWLYTIDTLKRQFDVNTIDVVIPTHYHDDHVAGCNLLREVEGTQVWAAANFADVLMRPYRYDLSCLWYDPIEVDRVLPLERPICWEEYELTLYGLPGHTLYAAAIAFQADNLRFLAAGDQYMEGYKWNYVYQNGFGPGDYRASSALYRRLAPDMILTGHWEPHCVQRAFLDRLEERDAALERLHEQLLPDTGAYPAQGLGVQIFPYQARVPAGETLEFEVQISNLAGQSRSLTAGLSVPSTWSVAERPRQLDLPALATGSIKFRVMVPKGQVTRRARVAVDLSVEGWRLGQQAEALVTVIEPDNQAILEVHP